MKMKKVFLTAMMSLMLCIGVFAQDCGTCRPEEYEIVLGTLSTSFSSPTYYLASSDWKHFDYGYTDQELYNILLSKAKQVYSNRSNLKIRNMKLELSQTNNKDDKNNKYKITSKIFHYRGTYSVVEVDLQAKAKTEARNTQNWIIRRALNKLEESTSKAVATIPNGARMAIDKITIPEASNDDAIRDPLLDILLDKGYRVVAKEYLERLYREQQDQQSGIYNERTTVQENNFSAVGYFINVKVTETSIRVQVVNVSTGEYEGNATVNF